jgi:prepilin-type N-terminal cleavage/methylation domain-containing protein
MKRFSLIELLVVVAIIGVLASFVLPALGKARNTSRKATCINNLRQMNTAMYIYSDDNNSIVITAAVNGSINYSKQLSENYNVSSGTFSCSMDDVVRSEPKEARSYSMNTGTSTTFSGSATPDPDDECDGPTRMATYNNISYNSIAADTILVLENWENINEQHDWARSDHTWDYYSYLMNWTDRPMKFHDARPNYSLIDGSVQTRMFNSFTQEMFTRTQD